MDGNFSAAVYFPSVSIERAWKVKGAHVIHTAELVAIRECLQAANRVEKTYDMLTIYSDTLYNSPQRNAQHHKDADG